MEASERVGTRLKFQRDPPVPFASIRGREKTRGVGLAAKCLQLVRDLTRRNAVDERETAAAAGRRKRDRMG